MDYAATGLRATEGGGGAKVGGAKPSPRETRELAPTWL